MLLKAISIKQPWANLIASGEKSIETRLWSTDYRGLILIVSSRQPKIEPAGYALAIATLVECRPMNSEDITKARCEVYDGAFAWCLQDIRPIRPKQVTGQLGLYDVEIDIEMADTTSQPALRL